MAGSANLFFLWAGIHQVGYFWHDRRLPHRPVVGVVWTVVGMGTLIALMAIGGYPVSMVAVDGEERSSRPFNRSPLLMRPEGSRYVTLSRRCGSVLGLALAREAVGVTKWPFPSMDAASQRVKTSFRQPQPA